MDVGVFRVRFSGKSLPGFDENQIRQILAEKLGFNSQQIASIFRGRPVTLKKNMQKSAADQYEKRLRSIGMDVRAEPETEGPGGQSAPAARPAAMPARPVAAPPAGVAAPASAPATRPAEAGAPLPRPQPPLATTPLRTAPTPIRPAPPQPPASPTPRPVQATPVPPPSTMPGEPTRLAASPPPPRELTRICPRCGMQIAAVRPCPQCFGKVLATGSAQRSSDTGVPLSTPTVPTPETQYLSTLLAEQELMADHSTDRRTYLSLSFTGRMHGLYYLWWTSITYILMRWLNIGDLLWRLSPHGSQIASPPSTLACLAILFLLFQAARLSVLRLHDIDRSGLWAAAHVAIYLILGLVSITCASLFFQFGIILLTIIPSDRHPNRHGSTPQGPDGSLEWFDSGRRCNRMFYLSRTLGVANATLTVCLALTIGVKFLNGLIDIFLPPWIHVLFINSSRLLFAVGTMASALSLRLMISRLHDFGMRGTWILPYVAACSALYGLMLVAETSTRWLSAILFIFLTLSAFVVLCTIPGKPSSNRFGKVPPETWQGDLWRQIVTLGILSGFIFLLGIAAATFLPDL